MQNYQLQKGGKLNPLVVQFTLFIFATGIFLKQ